MKIIFSIGVYFLLWFLQCFLLLSITGGIGMWDPSSVGSVPGIIGIVCLYTSYVFTKKINNNSRVKNFFNGD